MTYDNAADDSPAEGSAPAQIKRDLIEVDQQLDMGEIDEATADRLKRLYERELADLAVRPHAVPGRSPARVLVGALILAVSLGGIYLFASGSLRGRDAASSSIDLATVSNDQMEAVIAANDGSPEVNAMRLALADRYFDDGDFGEALSHYMIVLGNDPGAVESARALSRVGWMVYSGNGEVDLARGYLLEARRIAPTYVESAYLLGIVELCGAGDASAAIPLLAEVVESSEVPDDVRADAAGALEAARSGSGCG